MVDLSGKIKINIVLSGWSTSSNGLNFGPVF